MRAARSGATSVNARRLREPRQLSGIGSEVTIQRSQRRPRPVGRRDLLDVGPLRVARVGPQRPVSTHVPAEPAGRGHAPVDPPGPPVDDVREDQRPGPEVDGHVREIRRQDDPVAGPGAHQPGLPSPGPLWTLGEVLDEEASLTMHDLHDLRVAHRAARRADVDVAERLGRLPTDGPAGQRRQLVAQREVREVRILAMAHAVEHVVLDPAATAADTIGQHVPHVSQAAHQVLLGQDVRAMPDASGTQGERQPRARRQVGGRSDEGSDRHARVSHRWSG